MEQHKKSPVGSYYYSEDEWARLGCDPLPAERTRENQLQNLAPKGNPAIDGKNIRGYN